MAFDSGAGTGQPQTLFTLPGGPVVAGLEIHTGNPPSFSAGDYATGVNPLPPVDAPFTDPGTAPTSISGNALVPIRTNFSFNNAPGVQVRFSNPA